MRKQQLHRGHLTGDNDVAAGMVKWFNAANGYGIIKPDDGGVDLFVQIRAVEKAGYAALAEGTRIAFGLRTTAQAKCPWATKNTRSQICAEFSGFADRFLHFVRRR